MIRKATPNDIRALTGLCIEALEIDPYSELRISGSGVKEQVIECVSATSNFAWVSDVRGEVVGGLGAVTSPMVVYERHTANIVLWYVRSGREGMLLMNEFIRWVDGRPVIRQVEYIGERNGDKRILEILEKRWGFQNNVPFLYRMKGNKAQVSA